MSTVLSAVLIVEGDCRQGVCLHDNLWRSCLCDRTIHFSTVQDVLDFLCTSRPEQPRWDVMQIAIVVNAASEGVDAYDLLVHLKQNRELGKIPVVILAAAADSEIVFQFYLAGCSFFLITPSDYTTSMECINTVGAILSMPQIRLPQITKHSVPIGI